MTYQFCVPCAMGLESVTAREMKYLRLQDVKAEDRRVFFTGGAEGMARANLNLRTAERVLLVLARFTADSPDTLFESVRELPLENYIARDDAFPVKGHCLKSVLSSVPAVQSMIKKAAVLRLEKAYGQTGFAETGLKKQLSFLLLKNELTLMLDTTGEKLHKRGYRPAAQEAPIRETLAAGMLSLSQAYLYERLEDPFCGSGTILIEAALMARNIAPGINRRFAAEGFHHFLDAPMRAVFARERERAKSFERPAQAFRAQGLDIDPKAAALAMENARRAGVSGLVSAETGDIKSYRAAEGGLTVTNPPYGERMLDVRAAEGLYASLGRGVQNGACGVITPCKELDRLFGRRSDKRRKLYNGAIECQYYMYR